MCTIVAIRADTGVQVIKTRDLDRRPRHQRIERRRVLGVEQLVLTDLDGKWEGSNAHGVIILEATLTPRRGHRRPTRQRIARILTAGTAREAVRRALLMRHAGVALLIADAAETWRVEVTPGHRAARQEVGTAVLTNHGVLLRGEGASDGDAFGASSRLRHRLATRAQPSSRVDLTSLAKQLKTVRPLKTEISCLWHPATMTVETLYRR